MASRKYTLFFYVALVVAMGATYGVYRVIQSTKASNRIATGAVVVAAHDVQEGDVIDRVALNVVQWPVPTIPAGAYTQVDSVVGRVARVDVFSGEPFVPGRLAPEGQGAGLQIKVAPGRRAFPVQVNDVSSMSGLIKPNSRVDIILTSNPTANDKERRTGTIMSNVRVLAVNAVTQPGDDGRPIPAKVVTLDVSPDDAVMLAAAGAQGKLQFTLRGYGDPDTVVTQGKTASDVMRTLRESQRRTAVRPPTRPAPRPRVATPKPDPKPPVESTPAPVQVLPPIPQKPETVHVEVYRGGKKEDVQIKKDTVRRDTTGIRPDTGSVY